MKKQKNSLSSPTSKTNFITYFFMVSLVWGLWVFYKLWQITPVVGRVFGNLFPTQTLFPDWSALLFYIKGISIFSGIFLSAWSVGLAFLRVINFKQDSELERSVFAISIGYGFLSLLLWFLLMGQFYSVVVLSVFWFVALGASVTYLFKVKEDRVCIKKSIAQGASYLFGEGPIYLRIVLCFIVGFSFVMALVPDIFYDAAVYHLGVPNAYLREGGYVQLAGVHSRFPLLWQLLYGWGLALTDEIVAKLIHWSAMFLIVLSSFSLARRFKIVQAGFFAALFFVTVPMVQMNVWSAGIDIGSCLVSFLAVYALLAFLQEDNSTNSWIILSALMCGFSFGSKYQGGVLALCVGTVLLIFEGARLKNNFVLSVKRLLLFGLCSGVVVLPWLIKNFYDTGNPLFPFLSNLFEKLGTQTLHIDVRQAETLMAENRRFIIDSWTQIWQLPWRLVFADRNQSSLSFTGPLFLFLLPISFLLLQDRKKKWGLALILFLALFFGISIYSTHLTRYHLAGYPALCFAYALCFVRVRENKWLWHAFNVLLVGVFFVGIQQCLFIVENSYNPWNVLSGAESRDLYRSYSHPGMNPYPANVMYRWIEGNLPADSRIMLLADAKGFDLKRPYTYSDVHGKHWIVEWSRLGSADAIYKKFVEKKFTHVLVNVMETYRTYGYKTVWMTDAEADVFNTFWLQHARLLHAEKIPEKNSPQDVWLLLFEILPQDVAARKTDNLINPLNDIRKMSNNPQ